MLAIAPRGPAVGDPSTLACLGAAAMTQCYPVLLVATTPWAALPCAQACQAIGAQGVAVFLDTGLDAGTPLLALAIAEVRAAGLRLPVVAGPVPNGRSTTALLQRGADAVIVTAAAPRPGHWWPRTSRA